MTNEEWEHQSDIDVRGRKGEKLFLRFAIPFKKKKEKV
jgi:hypothetical protein